MTRRLIMAAITIHSMAFPIKTGRGPQQKVGCELLQPFTVYKLAASSVGEKSISSLIVAEGNPF
jgi:hypothetical protein